MPREPILLQIPNNLEPWEANNWRKLANALNAGVAVENKVNSTTTGLSTGGERVKIDEKDKVSGYLEDKLIAGTGISLTESLTGGAGSKILTAAIGAHNALTDMADTAGANVDHDTRYVAKVQAATPSTPTPFAGMLWYDTDEAADPEHQPTDVRLYATFAAAIAAIASNEITLLIPDAQTVSANITIPANITLKFLRGGSLAIANTIVVVINGDIDAGRYKIFDTTNTPTAYTYPVVPVDLEGCPTDSVYPEWWGADGTGAVDSAAAFQLMVNCGHKKFVCSPYATYDFATQVIFPTLKHAGGATNVFDHWQLLGNWALINGTADLASAFLLVSVDDAATTWTSNVLIEKLRIAGTYTNGFIEMDGGNYVQCKITELTVVSGNSNHRARGVIYWYNNGVNHTTPDGNEFSFIKVYVYSFESAIYFARPYIGIANFKASNVIEFDSDPSWTNGTVVVVTGATSIANNGTYTVSSNSGVNYTMNQTVTTVEAGAADTVGSATAISGGAFGGMYIHNIYCNCWNAIKCLNSTIARSLFDTLYCTGDVIHCYYCYMCEFKNILHEIGWDAGTDPTWGAYPATIGVYGEYFDDCRFSLFRYDMHSTNGGIHMLQAIFRHCYFSNIQFYDSEYNAGVQEAPADLFELLTGSHDNVIEDFHNLNTAERLDTDKITDSGTNNVYGGLATQAAETILANATGLAAVPTALALAEQTLAGRITGGHIVGLTPTQVRTLINVSDGASGTVTGVTGTSPVASSGGATPAISIPAATNAAAGHATAAHIQAIEANTAKVTNATHSGEVTGATALTITAKAITYAKIQDVSATDKLLGRATAGVGSVEEIPCTAFGRSLIDDADAAAAATTLGLGTTDGPTFAHLHLTDAPATGGALITAAESWIGPSATAGIYFKGGYVGIGMTPTTLLDVNGTATIRGYTIITTGGFRVVGAVGMCSVDANGNNITLSRPSANYFYANAVGGYFNFIVDGKVASDATAALSLRANGNVIIAANSGNVGIGTVGPTAVLHLKASQAGANLASLKIDSGVVATTPVSGNIESDGTNLYWTDSGGTRRQLNN